MFTLQPAKTKTNNNIHAHAQMHLQSLSESNHPLPWTRAWQSNEKRSHVRLTRMLRKQASSLTNNPPTCYSHYKKRCTHTTITTITTSQCQQVVVQLVVSHNSFENKRAGENSLNSSQIILLVLAPTTQSISSACSVFSLPSLPSKRLLIQQFSLWFQFHLLHDTFLSHPVLLVQVFQRNRMGNIQI